MFAGDCSEMGWVAVFILLPSCGIGYRLRLRSLWRCRDISASISSRKRAHSFPPHDLFASLRTHSRARFETRAGGRVSPNLLFFMPRMYNGVLHWRNKKMRDRRRFCEKARFYWLETMPRLQQNIHMRHILCNNLMQRILPENCQGI